MSQVTKTNSDDGPELMDEAIDILDMLSAENQRLVNEQARLLGEIRMRTDSFEKMVRRASKVASDLEDATIQLRAFALAE